MKTTIDYQDAIAALVHEAGWTSVMRLNTPEGVKFPLVNKPLGMFIVPVEVINTEGNSWLVCGSERDVLAWDVMVEGFANGSAIQDFKKYVEENEGYSLSGDSITKIVLDALWWSEWRAV